MEGDSVCNSCSILKGMAVRNGKGKEEKNCAWDRSMDHTTKVPNYNFVEHSEYIQLNCINQFHGEKHLRSRCENIENEKSVEIYGNNMHNESTKRKWIRCITCRTMSPFTDQLSSDYRGFTSKRTNRSSGFGFANLIFVVLITLHLCQNIL